MTGDELKALRLRGGLSRAALAKLAELHHDSVRYWERKAKVDLRGWAPDRILRALGRGDLVLRHTYPAWPCYGVFPHSTRAWGGVLLSGEKYKKLGACGARTRKGNPCRAMAINGKGRCKFHGGMSTGPKTVAGRARIAEAQRKRWAKMRGFPSPEKLPPDNCDAIVLSLGPQSLQE